MKIAGIVLAGGRSSRMGGQDKASVTLAGKTLLARSIAKLAPQVELIAVNSNSEPTGLSADKLPVLTDAIGYYSGPLAGILTGLEWAAQHNARRIVTVACDTPFFPQTLVEHLDQTNGIALASSAGRTHPVFGGWPVILADDLRRYLETDQRRSVIDYVRRHDHQVIEFELTQGYDPFFNINTPEDLAEATVLAQKFGL